MVNFALVAKVISEVSIYKTVSLQEPGGEKAQRKKLTELRRTNQQNELQAAKRELQVKKQPDRQICE